MKKVLLSDWFKFMLDCELENNVNCLVEDGVNKIDIERYKDFINVFFKFEGEDREIVLEDLKKDEGVLYKKMCDYNESELVIEFGFNMVCWEYSIEDYFRDMFDKNGFEKDEFSMFELRDINKMMYGEDYNDDDWEY
jgi:hypothetical protein